MIEADALSSGLGAGSVDVITSNLGINNFDDRDAILAECHRLLRPGGSLVISTNPRGHMAEAYRVIRAVLASGGWSAEPAAVDRLEAARGTREELTGWLERGGFTAAADHSEEVRWRFADGAALMGHRFMRLAFVPKWLALVAVEGRPAFDRALRLGFDQVAEREGEIALTIPVLAVAATRQ